MEKYRIYEKINGTYRLVTSNATKEQADNYKSDNRVLIIKQLEDRDETYKLIFEKFNKKKKKRR
jgi:hypothetical protein